MNQPRQPSVAGLIGKLGSLSLLILFLLIFIPIWLVVVYAIFGKTDMIAGTLLLVAFIAVMVVRHKNRPRP